jgi:hypothetical protein
MKLRDLWLYPKWHFMRLRCWLRRHHGRPVCIGVVPVRTGGGRKRHRVEMAQKITCSDCGTVLDLITNRAYRRGLSRGLPPGPARR